MNPRLDRLHAYPFERLARLKAGVTPAAGLAHIAMSIGEPQHSPPAFVLDSLRDNLHRLGSYPATAGLPEFRAAAARWLERRFGLHAVDAVHEGDFGVMVALRGTDIVRVKLAEATAELKTVPLERYAEAEVFFG